MNRGVLESSSVQQMMAGGSTGWWNNTPAMRLQPSSPHLSSSSSCLSALPQYPSPSTALPLASWHDNDQDLPESWSQLLLGGLGEEADDRCCFTPFQTKRLENWEDLVLYQHASSHIADVKEERPGSGYVYGNGNEDVQAADAKPSWNQILPASSPRSCVTSFSSNMLDFSSNNKAVEVKHPNPDYHSPECNSTATGSALKKARVQGSSTGQSTFKVRKEKLGDRITSLHQLVSPFGKTDTASVLLEAIGYIRFLQGQIEALSSPYLGNASAGTARNSAKKGERSCIFPEDPGQLLNDASIKRRAPAEKEGNEEQKKDLRSRGLCLVPISCTTHVGTDNGADYWAPTTPGGSCGGFRP